MGEREKRGETFPMRIAKYRTCHSFYIICSQHTNGEMSIMLAVLETKLIKFYSTLSIVVKFRQSTASKLQRSTNMAYCRYDRADAVMVMVYPRTVMRNMKRSTSPVWPDHNLG